MFNLLEMMKNVTQLFIEKIHILTCTYTATLLYQSVEKKGDWSH